MKCLAFVLLVVACAYAGPGRRSEVTCDWHECSVDCGGGTRRCDRSNGKKWNIDCHLQDCEAKDLCGIADIVFVIDDSTSIAEKNFWITKQFTIDIIKGVKVGPEESRIAYVTYSDRATSRFDFDEYQTEQDLEDAIWAIPKIGGNTHTADGLANAQALIMNGKRDSVKQIVIVVTDGVSNINRDMTIVRAQEMHQLGIEVFSVGIGKINEDELHGIASPLVDDHVFYVPDYDALTQITNTVLNKTCEATKRIECDPWNGWTDCILPEGETCGAGNRTRSRECRFYLFPGARPIIRIVTVVKPCEKPCPPDPDSCYWTECSQTCGGGTRSRICDSGKNITVPCNVIPCRPFPNCRAADVVFVLDSSASIGWRNWAQTTQFAVDIIAGLPVAPHAVNVAVVTFSRFAETDIALGEYVNRRELEDKVTNLGWLAQVTNTQDGLGHARDIFSNSDRKSVQRVAIVVSDGQSNVESEKTIPAAEALRDEGVEVFSVSVRTAANREMTSIASEPKWFYYHDVADYDALQTITGQIINGTCSENHFN